MGSKDRLEALRSRKAKLEKELAALEAREKEKTRKEETRLKLLVGAAMLDDAKTNPESAAVIKKVLQRAIAAERDRTFLQGKGWLPGQPKNGKNAQDKKPGQ